MLSWLIKRHHHHFRQRKVGLFSGINLSSRSTSTINESYDKIIKGILMSVIFLCFFLHLLTDRRGHMLSKFDITNAGLLLLQFTRTKPPVPKTSYFPCSFVLNSLLQVTEYFPVRFCRTVPVQRVPFFGSAIINLTK